MSFFRKRIEDAMADSEYAAAYFEARDEVARGAEEGDDLGGSLTLESAVSIQLDVGPTAGVITQTSAAFSSPGLSVSLAPAVSSSENYAQSAA